MSTELKTKQTIFNTVRKICSEIGPTLNVDYQADAVDLIAELIYKKLLIYGSDLEAFQKHAKRSTINVDDVKLLVRKNNSLKELVENKIQQYASTKSSETSSTTTATKRKRKATTSTS